MNFLGHQLRNPIGIAAGFDKHGEAIATLGNIGFGFVEIGSVTPLPQSGNPRPRVFRLKEDAAIVNRYGFNSDGHDVVYERVQRLRDESTTTARPPPIGINLGKNKLSTDAIADYVDGVRKFASIADYLVINISSPNTPGLRDWQSKDDLKRLLRSVLAAARSSSNSDHRTVPIVLKLSPDLSDAELADVSQVICHDAGCRVDGIIVSNTTTAREASLRSGSASEAGGLSGRPLATRSTEMIWQMYRLTDGRVPIIGVGGVFSGRDAYEKILAGASVVQLYTAFAYGGAPVVGRVKRELAELLQADGYRCVADAVGKRKQAK